MKVALAVVGVLTACTVSIQLLPDSQLSELGAS